MSKYVVPIYQDYPDDWKAFRRYSHSPLTCWICREKVNDHILVWTPSFFTVQTMAYYCLECGEKVVAENNLNLQEVQIV